jgi:hypothetical protein
MRRAADEGCMKGNEGQKRERGKEKAGREK